MRKIVISLGGSLLFDADGRFDGKFAKEIAQVLKKIAADGIYLIVITGGGKKAREYANAARKKYGSEFYADREAIKATRENAKEMIKMLGNAAYGKVLQTFDEVDIAISQNKIGVGGGMLEGLTTDAISVLFAEKINADMVVNLGDTDGIYTADPKKNKDAKRISSMKHSELVELAIKYDSRKAGTHFVFDLVAAKLSARSNKELRFVNGKDFKSLIGAINGSKFEGTKVKD